MYAAWQARLRQLFSLSLILLGIRSLHANPNMEFPERKKKNPSLATYSKQSMLLKMCRDSKEIGDLCCFEIAMPTTYSGRCQPAN
jgi:hypothetical protein